MKKLFSLIAALALVAFAVPAMAGTITKQVVPFGLYSAASGTAVYSSVINVMPYRNKTIQINGYAMAAKTEAALSGTALVQCGPTPNGPWVTCAQEDGTAISTTANANFMWSDVTSYVRISWAKTAGRVSAWLNLSE